MTDAMRDAMRDAVPDALRDAASDAGAARARFRRADALLDAALDRPTGERTAFVDAAAADDPALRAEVHALLGAHAAVAAADDFLATPAAPDPLRDRLAPALAPAYRLRRCVGAGGMARVYLADDLRHGRAVAVKALDAAPPATAGASRFLAEVRVMARLQHPHLLPLLDSGTADGVPYLVMPYVDGGTLRERLADGGALPVAEAVRLARAIAGALAHAHAAGVVHRDLKPENVLLRDGEPLVADFGIALAAADARLTRSGVAIGTPQYMAPEQASGDAAIDARADVYALGTILYEMLTGDPPHVASTTQGVLAKVRAERPAPVRLLRDTVPAPLSDAVDRALAKRPADRFPTAAAFAAALALPPDVAPDGAPDASRGAGRARRRGARPLAAGALPGVLAGVLAAGALGAVAVRRAGREAPDPGAAAPGVAAPRFVVAPIAEAAIGRPPTLTPDGASLVYAGAAGTGRRLFVRPVGALAARPLQGTDGALAAAVSPDGATIAYVTEDDRLLRVPLAGGTPVVLGGAFRYSTVAWAGPSHLVLDEYGAGGLTWRPADGGPPRLLTRVDAARRDAHHLRPLVLPDGRSVVFSIQRDVAGPGAHAPGPLGLVTLDPARPGAAPHTELSASARRAVGWVDGWLLYVSGDGARLVAQRLDLAARRLVGPAVPVLDDPAGEIAVAALGRDGTLLYTRQQPRNEPVWVDTTGRAAPALGGRAGRYMNPRLSPDGRRLVTQLADAGGNDVWVHDLAVGTAARVTHTGGALSPTWTPDGAHVVYFTALGGREGLWRAAADGRTPPERLLAASGVFAPTVSPDGREVVFQRSVGGVWQIWAVPLDAPTHGARTARPVVVGRASAGMPALSPDGRWLAYASNASGRYEVYLRAWPGPGAEVRVSRDGGAEPAWSPEGRRLFFRGDRRLYVAAVRGGARTAPSGTAPSGAAIPAVGAPRVLFTDAFDGDMPMPHRNYDVARDPRGAVRFVMIGGAGGAAETVVALRWRDELRARLAGAARP